MDEETRVSCWVNTSFKTKISLLLALLMRKLFCAWLLFVSIALSAQQSADTFSRQKPYPVSIYYDSLGEQSPLFNAREYVAFPGIIHQGHPFYKTTEFVTGTIHYDGMFFDDAKILYDIITNKVLVLHYNGIFRIDLPVDRISEFNLHGHRFVHLYPDSSHVIDEGFYDQLYDGKTDLFVKRTKLFREERTGTDILRVVDEKDFFFIRKQDTYRPVRSKKSLLNIFKDRKDEIRREIKKKGIKYRKNREAAILTAVQYYDSVSN